MTRAPVHRATVSQDQVLVRSRQVRYGCVPWILPTRLTLVCDARAHLPRECNKAIQFYIENRRSLNCEPRKCVCARGWRRCPQLTVARRSDTSATNAGNAFVWVNKHGLQLGKTPLKSVFTVWGGVHLNLPALGPHIMRCGCGSVVPVRACAVGSLNACTASTISRLASTCWVPATAATCT